MVGLWPTGFLQGSPMRLRSLLEAIHRLIATPPVRVSAGQPVRLRDPDAILVLPEQDFFLRDNHGGSVRGPGKCASPHGGKRRRWQVGIFSAWQAS